MPSPRSRLKAARSRSRGKPAATLLACALGLFSCKPEDKPAGKLTVTPAAKSISAADTALRRQLAAARIDNAMAEINASRPERAVPLLIAALKADPASEEARGKLEELFSKTTWSCPSVRIKHSGPVKQLAFMPPLTLWASLGGASNTTVRWNIQTQKVESVLFPVPACETRALIHDPSGKSIVVQRGGITLLCDATTLKPICDLGSFPDSLTPASVIVFSPDGLLLAHPTGTAFPVTWNIRDAATGQVIRTLPPEEGNNPQPIAAYLNRTELSILTETGGLIKVPISPTAPVVTEDQDIFVRYLYGQFSSDGKQVLALESKGPHHRPSFSGRGQSDVDTLNASEHEKRFSWSAQPNIWTGMFRESGDSPFVVESSLVRFPPGTNLFSSPVCIQAGILTNSAVTSMAFDQNRIFTGEQDGTLTIHQLLPLPGKSEAASQSASIDPTHLKALENLGAAVSGWQLAEDQRSLAQVDRDARVEAAKACDLKILQGVFPSLNFESVFTALTGSQPQPAADALDLLTSRLAQTNLPPPDQKITSAFSSGDDTAIQTAIRETGGKGPSAALALQIALQSDHVPWIQASLSIAENLPDLLKRLAVARIARLENRNADALSLWPDEFPDLTAIRLREDWDGWEQADFMPAFTEMRTWAGGELAAIDVGPDTTPEQRKAIAARLLDPATVASVGKPRFAAACLKAALAFSTHTEEFETTLKLTALARNLGAPPEPCLRAEALAYTALGDYKNAHPRWIELITEHPVETHIPGDYAEAAYTAFENADPGQAMQILTTGMHRFPRDGNFALRAGWVALLTGNSARAYQFLTSGRQIGFPPEKYENAVALLAIAASLVGATDDAAVYFQELLKIDPVWAEAKTLDTLDWPEELKSELRQFMR